ncbi:hypothetical protein [Caenimonas koreensis]|uniref:Transposase n=1 Tax=Caenimonas koreensis DSM 17982 TaxID=1121255 RepID=A0A844B9N4_9BURK|nr:hypothetical protein [Caenimonas koreensis]MRD47241.1 hypothetical protein [Caenimonas koreensis DSM 17982]
MKEPPRKDSLRITLNATPEQVVRLVALQQAFALLCNTLAPLVQQNRNWNRVTLHHLAYRSLRQQFPAIGSQMVCNAIYAVSRTSRVVFQHPDSPFHVSRMAGKPLPLIHFADTNPVYFDRHTLSLKAGVMSLYTLDGRMRMKLPLKPADESLFHERKLREVILSRRKDDKFELLFSFMEPDEDEPDERALPSAQQRGQLPDYVKVKVEA